MGAEEPCNITHSLEGVIWVVWLQNGVQVCPKNWSAVLDPSSKPKLGEEHNDAKAIGVRFCVSEGVSSI